MKRNIDKIVLHYLVAVLFTEEEDDNGLSGLSAVCDFDNKPTNNANMNTMEHTKLIVESFMAMALPLLTDDWTDEQIGHDLWLTRCGHGAGFWDRDLPNGDKLTEIAKLMEFHGEVYAENGVAYIHESEFSTDLVLSEYERLPQNVQDILIECEDFENTYEACDELQKKLEAVGYTISYYLNAEPYHLRYKG